MTPEGARPDLPDDLDPVRRRLLDWYAADHRPYPWRETTDPYAILVCEVMSQQTQLDRVVQPWTAFLDRWPTVEALADAEQADVVGFWSAHRLGYNNRARYLHEAAELVVEEYGGTIPTSIETLQQLPGVGPYTATAVASFAFDADAAVVDTNVERVLCRAVGTVEERGPAVERAAAALLPAGQSRRWNNAMMELGAEVCGRTPRCDDEPCPWRDWCAAYETGDFTAPDVPTQPAFEGSRRQFRGRVVRTLGAHGELSLDDLGSRIRVDYTPDGEHGRAWLQGLLADLADDGLVRTIESPDGTTVRLRR